MLIIVLSYCCLHFTANICFIVFLFLRMDKILIQTIRILMIVKFIFVVIIVGNGGNSVKMILMMMMMTVIINVI